jgi:hypothetical protein
MPIVRQQQHTIMPFIMQQQLHMPPISAEHRFCTIETAMGSSHEQVIFIPPWHFSILKVQRGTIIQLAMPAGIPDGPVMDGMPMPIVPMPGIPIRVASIIGVVAIRKLLSSNPAA